MSWLKNLMPWRCTPVLPTVYDDSLSYMEMLCKLTKAMDTLSEHLSNFESAILEQLQQLNDRIDQIEPSGGGENVYIIDIGEIEPNGETISVDDAEYLAMTEAFASGKEIFCRCQASTWPGFKSYNGTLILPLTASIKGGAFFNFSGIVSPYPWSGGDLYDVHKSWVATLGMTGQNVGLTIAKLNELNTPPAITGSLSSGSIPLTLEGGWEITGATSDASGGSLIFTNKNGVTVATCRVSAGVGSTFHFYGARAVDGLISNANTTIMYTAGSASDGDNVITAVKWDGSGSFTYNVVQ